MRKLRIFSSILVLNVFVGITAAQGTSNGPRVVIGPNLRASDNVKEGGRNECWISASRTNPNLLVGVSQNTTTPNADQTGAGSEPRMCTTLISKNGGQTWREILLPKQAKGCFDTMTASAPDGRIYVSQPLMGRNFGLDDMSGSSGRAEGAIHIYSTPDEGKTWQGPNEVSSPIAEDHPRMIVDDSNGPHRGRLYIEWNDVYDTILKDTFHIFLRYSDDHGQTFSDPILVTTAISKGGKLVATEPVVLSDGTLILTYYQYFNPLSDPRNNSQPFYIIRSTDGGNTFGAQTKIMTLAPSAWLYLLKDFNHAFALPIVAADTSATSAYRDRIYIVWQDIRDGDANIWLSKSTDKGTTWSEPKRLNDNRPSAKGGPPDFRVTPVVAVNKAGVVGVAWYDYRDDPTHVCWKQYFTYSSDGGDKFMPNVAVSDQPSCPAKDGFKPSVYAWNISPFPEDMLPTADEISHADEMSKIQLAQMRSAEEAIRAHEREFDKPQIDVTFDHDRNLWPGHYTGLTADTDGVFHVLWSDRRAAPLQQLYTATVQVAAGPQAGPPRTQEANVTKFVRIYGQALSYDAKTHETTFELQLRNVSDQAIYAPVRVVIDGIGAVSGKPTADVVTHDGSSKTKTSWDFSKLLGSSEELAPGMVSEAKKIVIRTNEATGLDGVLNFEITGQLAQTSASGTVSESAIRR